MHRYGPKIKRIRQTAQDPSDDRFSAKNKHGTCSAEFEGCFAL